MAYAIQTRSSSGCQNQNCKQRLCGLPNAIEVSKDELEAAARLSLSADYEDRAIYVVDGVVEIAGCCFVAGRMLVLRFGENITLTAISASRLMLLGGEPLEEPRFIWWNFVASRKEMIEGAKRAWEQGDWENGRFTLLPNDNEEFDPLPD